MNKVNSESLGYKPAHLAELIDTKINTATTVIQGFCGTLPVNPLTPKQLTKQEMLDRINLLSGEMDANDEENKMMQEEITSLYAKIDTLT